MIEISIFTAPNLLGTHTLLHRIKTSGVKIGPLLKIPVGSEYASVMQLWIYLNNSWMCQLMPYFLVYICIYVHAICHTLSSHLNYIAKLQANLLWGAQWFYGHAQKTDGNVTLGYVVTFFSLSFCRLVCFWLKIFSNWKN